MVATHFVPNDYSFWIFYIRSFSYTPTLPETIDMPSARPFFEFLLSGTRQKVLCHLRWRKPSTKIEYSVKQCFVEYQNLANIWFAECQKKRPSAQSDTSHFRPFTRRPLNVYRVPHGWVVDTRQILETSPQWLQPRTGHRILPRVEMYQSVNVWFAECSGALCKRYFSFIQCSSNHFCCTNIVFRTTYRNVVPFSSCLLCLVHLFNF